MDIGLILGELFSGVTYLFSVEGLKTLVMFVIAGVLIYLAIKKDYEPTLLLPIGFGAILANLPPVIDAVSGKAAASVLGESGFLSVLFAKVLNIFRKKKINPMVGAAGISAFPMSARVIQKMAKEEDPYNFILMQSISANVSGQLGSIVAGGMVISLVSMLLGGIW